MKKLDPVDILEERIARTYYIPSEYDPGATLSHAIFWIMNPTEVERPYRLKSSIPEEGI